MRNFIIILICLFSISGFANPLKRAEVKCIYDSQLNVREQSGKNDGKDVEKYLRYTKLGKGYAWCAAFVCWVYGSANVENPQTAWSPSMFPAKNLIYQKGSKVFNQQPQTGDVFGIYFSNLKRIAHVGFVDSWDEGNYAITVEGNTNDAGSREGDGVYRKRRLKNQIYKVSDFIR